MVPECLRELQRKKDKILEVVGGKAETYAKKLCPKDTGNLQNSITHQQIDKDSVLIGTAVEYAPFVELGHHQEPGRYVPAIKKRLVKDWVPAKPFLRPAIENHMDEYKNVIEKVMKE
jgi:phage gpG-like protein